VPTPRNFLRGPPASLHRVTGDSRSASCVRGVAALLLVSAVARSGPPASHLRRVGFVGVTGGLAQRIYFFIFHAIKQSICRLKNLLRELPPMQPDGSHEFGPLCHSGAMFEALAPWSCIETTLLTKHLITVQHPINTCCDAYNSNSRVAIHRRLVCGLTRRDGTPLQARRGCRFRRGRLGRCRRRDGS
jgi:hypothetical protein